MPFLAAVVGAVVGAFAGWWIPTFAYRLSVAWGEPARTTCHVCASALRRRCPGCHTRLGPSPWWTIPITSVSAAIVAASTPNIVMAVTAVAFVVLGVLLAAIDIAVSRLPDSIVWRAGVIGFAGAWLGGHPWRSLAAGAVLLGAYAILAVLAGGQVGMGDVKLAGALGLLLGWYGWPTVVLGALLGFLINGLVAVVLLITGKVGWRSSIPMGPSILAGALVAIALQI